MSKNKIKYRFIHINKTAGNSIYDWFLENNYSLSKKRIHKIPVVFQPNTIYFAIVRNPYARVLSQYKHWKDNLKRIDDNIQFEYYLENLDRPSLWLKKQVYINYYSTKYNMSCYSWLHKCEKETKLKVFKYEELDKLVEYFIKELKFKNNFGHADLGKTIGCNNKIDQYYNTNCYEIVTRRMEKDFDTYGYKRYNEH